MKKLKRILCIIMSAVILVTAPIASYMEARAVEVIALPFLEDLLMSLGISFGLGAQNEFSSQLYDNNLKDYFDAAASGGTFKLPEFGTVDFSDSRSIMTMLERSMRVNMSLLTGDASHMQNPLFDGIESSYADAALKLDLASYHNTGTCATNAMDESISELYEEYEADFGALADDVQECFTIIKNGGDLTSLGDESGARMQKVWKVFSAVVASGMVGSGNAALPLAALKEYENSDFSEYDAVFGDAYFDGSYKTNFDQQYVYSISGEGEGYRFVFDKVVSSSKIVGVINHELNRVSFLTLGYNGSSPVLSSVSLRISKQIVLASGRVYENGKYYGYCGLDNFSGNIPLYSSGEAALNALVADSFSDAENLQSSYADFKSNTRGAGAVVGKPFSGFFGSIKSLGKLIDIFPALREASDTYGGTAKALEEVAKILDKAAGAAVADPGVDDPDESSGSYSGILGKILSAIKSLPAGILAALTSKFMTANTLTNLINSLPQLFVVSFSAMIDLALKPVIAAIDAVPVLMNATLSDIFPDSITAGKALISIPVLLNEGFASVVKAVGGIAIDIPEIVIPDIAIPEIVLPEIVLPDIALPDVFVDSPVIALSPTYDITVANDWLGLDDVISRSVQKVVTDVFVPDETAALEKVGEMQEYFKFTEDMKDIISEFEKSVFGITPSPILKIPIGKSKSKKYDYGLGNYIIIDVGWYAEYKDFGDKIILAFAWVFFIWRMFVLLPGIINGTVGGFFTPERVDRMILDSDIKKDYAKLHEMRRDYTTGGVYGKFSGAKFKD